MKSAIAIVVRKPVLETYKRCQYQIKYLQSEIAQPPNTYDTNTNPFFCDATATSFAN